VRSQGGRDLIHTIFSELLVPGLGDMARELLKANCGPSQREENYLLTAWKWVGVRLSPELRLTPRRCGGERKPVSRRRRRTPPPRPRIGRDERPRSGPRGMAVTSAGGAGQMAVTSGGEAVRQTDAKLFGHFCTFLHMCKTVSHTPYAKTFSLFGARFRCLACLSPCVACARTSH